MSYHTVTVHIPFLEFLHDNILTGFFVFHMHHRIMKVRIEFLSQGLDLLDACVFQRLHKLSIYFIHAVYKRIVFLSVFNALEPSLAIIDNRQDLLNIRLLFRNDIGDNVLSQAGSRRAACLPIQISTLTH